MQALAFYLTYPIIYLIASLPFRALYMVSDGLHFLLRLSGYRKEVILVNLKNAFPEKTQAEINKLCDDYYRYLCDLILETFKTLTMTEKEARERCLFHKADWMEKLRQEGQSIILVLGHYGNWEWAGPGFQLNSGFPLVVIYRPLSNPYFERMMVRMRTKFGTRIAPVQQTLRELVASRHTLTATTFIADQAAPKESSYWMTFLHQDTSVFTGPEKLAMKFNYPVVYLNIARPRRGYYELHFEPLALHPKESKENEITTAFMNRLEKEIVKDPIPWLWSHKRWKHRREPVTVS